jgi:hypothetical protein
MENEFKGWILYEIHTMWCVSVCFLSGSIVYWASLVKGMVWGWYVYSAPACLERIVHTLNTQAHYKHTYLLHIPFATLVQYTILPAKKHRHTPRGMYFVQYSTFELIPRQKSFRYMLFYVFLKLFMYLYIYRSRSSWIIHEVFRWLYVHMAYNYTKPWTLAYIFILRQIWSQQTS